MTKKPPTPFEQTEPEPCRNCGAARLGRYCPACGEDHETNRPRPVFGIFGDFFGELFEWDSKFFRTMRLLLTKPGQLSVEYRDGHRRQFVRPVRLYIFVSTLYFLFFAFFNPFEQQMDTMLESADQGYQAGRRGDSVYEFGEMFGRRAAQIVIDDNEAPESQPNGETVEAELPNELGDHDQKTTNALKLAIQQREEELGRELEGPEAIEVALELRGITLEEASEEIQSGLNKWMPIMMLLFIPLIAAVQCVLYFKEHPYFETHLVFIVYYYIFTYLVAILLTPLNLLPAGASVSAVVLTVISLTYFGFAMRRFYGGPKVEFACKLAIMVLAMLMLSCCSGIALWGAAFLEFAYKYLM